MIAGSGLCALGIPVDPFKAPRTEALPNRRTELESHHKKPRQNQGGIRDTASLS